MTWFVASNAGALSPEQIARLASYITRYAQTMGVTVHAVGGFVDHLHVVFDLPATQTLEKIAADLQKTTVRFLRESLGSPTFAWGGIHAVGITDGTVDFVTAYVAENGARHQSGQIEYEWEPTNNMPSEPEDEVPAWLRDAIANKGRKD